MNGPVASHFLSGAAAHFAWVRRLVSVVRVRPFDCTTEQGRSQERYRRAALAALASVAGRVVSVVTMLVVVPLTVGYLGPERYGLWTTITSFVAFLAFADLGIGNGLINSISEAHARDDRAGARRFVSSGFFTLLALAGLMLAAFAAAYPFVPWPLLFNVKSEVAAREAGPAMAALVGCLALNVVLGIVPRVQAGYQEGAANATWSAVGGLVGLAAVVTAVRMRLGLPWLVIAVAGGPVAALALNGVVLLVRRPWLRPAWTSVRRDTIRHILSLGLLFFVMQVAVAVGFSTDNLIVARVIDADAVTRYSIPQRLFIIPISLVALILHPLWPAYAEALARGDAAWARRTLRRSVVLAVGVAAAAALVLVWFGPQLLRLWLGPHAATPPRLLLVGFGAWVVLNAAGQAMAMLFNAARVMRFQVVSALSMAVTAVALNVLLTRRIGIAGAVWGTVIAYTLCCVVPWFFFVPRMWKTLAPKAA